MKLLASTKLQGLAPWLHQRPWLAWMLVAVSLAMASTSTVMLWRAGAAAPPELTQEDIDAAVRHTLETQPLPSRPARAAELVRQSVVRVRGYVSKPPQEEPPAKSAKPGQKKAAKPDPASPPELPDELSDEGARPGERGFGIGSGVVILDNGTILTNLHVVAGAERLSVTFHDGTESDAVVVGLHPNNDLAVIRAKKIPDDLPPATMGVSARLRPGDEVVAVGFPFGIGPSVSSGVVSGLNRSWRSSKGKNLLSGLIQFDAAANPGNSGGPLINMEGELVGIVTAILNPTEARTFIGIGFAVTMESAGTAVGIPPF